MSNYTFLEIRCQNVEKIFSYILVVMFGSAAHQRRAKFWNKSTSLDIDSVEGSASDPNRNSFSPRSASPVSLVSNLRKHKSVEDLGFAEECQPQR